MKKRNLLIATGQPTLHKMIDVLSGVDVENVQRQNGIHHDSSESLVQYPIIQDGDARS